MLARTFAGAVLGFPLSIAIVALAIWLWPGSSESAVIPLLVLFFPLWIGVMACTFLFRSGLRAWGWLVAANILAFAALFLAKHTLPGL